MAGDSRCLMSMLQLSPPSLANVITFCRFFQTILYFHC